MHSTSAWLHIARVQRHRWRRPPLWAGLVSLSLLLAWQVTTSAALQAATPIAIADPWQFVDESKPGVPPAKGELTPVADDEIVNGNAPVGIAARFQLSSTMQALALQYAGVDVAGLPLRQVEELRYCTRLIEGPRPYAVMLQLNIDADVTDGDRSWQGRLVYTPADNGAVIQGEWQCWNTLVGKWWATSGPLAAHATSENPLPLGTLLASFPHMGIHADYSALVLKAGDGWSDFLGEASSIVMGVEGEQAQLAFGTEIIDTEIIDIEAEPDEVLLPVLYQEPEASSQEEKEEQAQPDKRERDWRDVDWENYSVDDIDWEKLDWEQIEWDQIEWGNLDWGNIDWDFFDIFGWSSLGRYESRKERIEALKAFVDDVRQCKNGGWEEMGFDRQGECVAYYAQEHSPSDFDPSTLRWGDFEWGRSWRDRDSRNNRYDRDWRGGSDRN